MDRCSGESIKRTIEFAKELNPDTAQFLPLMVYPGTEAFEEAKEKARALKAQGLSLGKSARIMKVTPPTIKNYLEDYPYKA